MSGVGLRIEIRDDDRDIRLALRRLARWSGGDMYGTFDEIGGYLETATRLRFLAEEDPEGRPWKPSRPSYDRGPARSGRSRFSNPDRGKTLQASGRLLRSITHVAHRTRSETGTNVVYASPHQFGDRTEPRVIRPRRKKALSWPGAPHPVRRVNHPGSVVPKRAFLGASTRDKVRIVDIVERNIQELWF